MLKKKIITILLSTCMLISTLVFPKIIVNAAGINGWQKNATTWNYYINGNKATNWISSDGKWYYLNSNGDMATGWVATGGKWYYLNSNGDMATGWVATGGRWYYLNSNGDMATGWVLNNNKWYYLKSNGDMAVNETTADGYVVGTDGAWNSSADLVSEDKIGYAASIEKMQQLKVMDAPSGGDINGAVTRGQLVKAIAIAKGLSSATSNLNGTTIFPDIAANSDLSGYVNGVVGSGLMFGMPDGYFRPEQFVTNAEADTIMVRMLDYTDADPELTKLTWPNNYIQKAYTLKLTTDMIMNKSNKLTYKVEAVLLDRLFGTLIKGSQTAYFSSLYFEDQYLNTDITGTLKEVEVIGNSKTSDNLNDNQVLLAINGVPSATLYTLNSNAGDLVLGVKYKLYIDVNNITKVSVKENSTENYAVTSVASTLIAYKDDKNLAKTMTLPQASLYYYHGVPVDYQVAANAVKAYSSIILTKKSDNSGYDYGVIIDPNFAAPQVYKADNARLLEQIKNTRYAYIYRGANIQESNLNAYDVVYFVSDIWNKNTFIYVTDKVVNGTITAFLGEALNPTGVTINKIDYKFGKYFNKAKLNNYDGSIGNFITNVNINDYKTLLIGVDGKIVDIY